MSATRRVKGIAAKKKRIARPPVLKEWPPKFPPLSLLEPYFFDEPEPPDCQDHYDPPGWPC